MSALETNKVQERCKGNFMNLSYQSENLDQLFTALAKAQGSMKIAGQKRENPFFHSTYSDLADLVEASRAQLSSNGLSVIQIVMPIDGVDYLITRLCHCSGQWIESRILIKPEKSDVQSLGKSLTYLKRYSYSSIIGVVTSDDPLDDDGEDSRKNLEKNKKNIEKKKDEENLDTITDSQKQQILNMASECSDKKILPRILMYFKAKNLDELLSVKFEAACVLLQQQIEQSRKKQDQTSMQEALF